jgi:hypothetical protein
LKARLKRRAFLPFQHYLWVNKNCLIMDTNHEMNYYNYGKSLSAEGIVKSWLLNKKGEGEGEDNHEYVDLGLPSGTLWATTNIQDANGNELYFAWGETQGYTSGQVGTDKYFAWAGDNADYKYGTYDEMLVNLGMAKYNIMDRKTELESEDDAATANWGSDWRMPTQEQFDELAENTAMAWTQVDGVSGVLFTSRDNTNKLFFPAFGYAANGEIKDVGEYGGWWSVSLSNNILEPCNLHISQGGRTPVFYRCYGQSVRPVRSNN